MRTCTLFVALLALLFLAAPVGAAPAEEGPAAGTVTLKYKALRNFKLDLPAAAPKPVAAQLAVKGAATPFTTTVEGEALAIDTNGDGTTDVKIEGKTGFVAFKTKGDNPYRYALRLANNGQGWTALPGCARLGMIGDTLIQVIDQDGNGSYADIGTDAMIVGTSKSACFLSNVINVAGTLYTINVKPDGRSLTYTPYKGAQGTLDLRSAHSSQAKVLSVLVKSTDGKRSYDLARHTEGLLVPAGTYTLVGGKLGLGDNRVSFHTGRATPIQVAADAKTKVAWGGPLRAEFVVQVGAEEIAFRPDHLWYFGAAGEQYVNWTPFGKSPEFTVVDRKTRSEISKAIFTGC